MDKSGGWRQRLRGTSRTSAFVALALALVGGGLFWRLHEVFAADALIVNDGDLVKNVLFPFLVLSFGCLLISFISIILTSRQNRIISRERSRSGTIEQMVDLVAKLDDEHTQSFSSWLHDSLGHGLVLLKMELEHLARDGRLDAAASVAAVRHLDSLLSEVRGMSSSLYPKILAEVGLKTALESLVGHYREMSHFEVDSSIGDLPSHEGGGARAFAVYRTVQECLTNAAKHGDAEFVWVSVHENDGRITGTVLNHVRPAAGRGERSRTSADDSDSGGIGLELMALRLRRIGGSLSFGWDGEGVFKVDFVA